MLAQPIAASSVSPAANRAASTPQKQSPAPVVSTTAGGPALDDDHCVGVTATAPALPRVTITVWSGREINRRAAEAMSSRGTGTKAGPA